MKTKTLILLIAAELCCTLDAAQPPLAKVPFFAKEAKGFQQQWAKYIKRPDVFENSVGMKMVLLPPGEFTMGRTEKQLE